MMPTIDAQSELIDRLEAEVIRVGAERDAALAEVGDLKMEVSGLRATANQLLEELKVQWTPPPEVAGLQAERDAALAEVDRLGEQYHKCMSRSDRDRVAIQEAFYNGADEDAWPPGMDYADALGPFVDRLRDDAARMDLLESRLVRAVWVECGQGRLFRLTTTDGRCHEGTTARGAIDAAMDKEVPHT